MISLDKAIDLRIGEVRTDPLDITFGEIINLHESKEFIIQPAYQRLFRWTDEQRSRLVESILLQLPIPQIFVIENQDGVFELIDGLQRISSVIQFIDSKQINLRPLVLKGCDLIKELNGLSYDDLSLKLKLTIKRATVRSTVIKRQSLPRLRYEMFKRLNTGGSILSAQEIRNCNARMVGNQGVNFYSFIQKLANNKNYKHCIETLSQSDRDEREDEELILRYLALKNSRNTFAGNVRDWLDEYQEKIVLGKEQDGLDMQEEKSTFDRLFRYIDSVSGSSAFVRFNKDNLPIGGLAPAYFEAVTMGILESIDDINGLDPELVQDTLIKTVQSNEFRVVTGPGANSKPKLNERIALVRNNLLDLQ